MIVELVDGVIGLMKQEIGYFRKLEDLPGQKALDDNLVSLMSVTPAAYVLYSGGRFGGSVKTAFRQEGNPEAVVAIITRNLRDNTGRAATRGDARNPGAYQALEDVRRALLGKVPAPGFGALEITAERLYAIKSGAVLYLQSYRSSYQLTA